MRTPPSLLALAAIIVLAACSSAITTSDAQPDRGDGGGSVDGQIDVPGDGRSDAADASFDAPSETSNDLGDDIADARDVINVDRVFPTDDRGRLCSSDDACTSLGPAYFCENYHCVTCATVADHHYLVDTGGDDRLGTGAGGTVSGVLTLRCSFSTLTHAMAFLREHPDRGADVQVFRDDLSLVTGEVFPIRPPIGTSIDARPRSGIYAPPDQIAFDITESDVSLIANFRSGSGGVRVGGDASGVSLVCNISGTHATVLSIEGNASATLEAGQIRTCGRYPSVGLDPGTPAVRVSDRGHLTLAPTGRESVSLRGNYLAAIWVEGQGRLTIDSSRVPTYDGVYLGETVGDNLHIEQDPMTAPPLNDLDGFTVGSVSGYSENDVLITAGSNVRMRHAIVNGSAQRGVTIDPYVRGAMRYNDVSLIDFGSAGDPGLNRLAGLEGGLNMISLCVRLDALTTPQVLRARGNFFSRESCAATPAPTLRWNRECVVWGDGRPTPHFGIVNPGTSLDTADCPQTQIPP